MSPIGRSCSVATRGSYIYWGNGDSIGRARLDGSQADSAFIVGASNVQGIAVASKYIYWTNAGSQAIGRAEARWQRGRPDLHTDRLVAKWHRNWRVAYLLVQLQSPYHRARKPRRLRREPELHPRCARPGRPESRFEVYLLVRNQCDRAGQPGRKRHQPRLHLRGDDSAGHSTSGALSVVGRGGLEPPTSALTQRERSNGELAIANDVTPCLSVVAACWVARVSPPHAEGGGRGAGLAGMPFDANMPTTAASSGA